MLDTLAIAALLSPEQIVDQGLRERVETAQKRTSAAIEDAAYALREFGITANEIRAVVDAHVAETAEKLKKAIQGYRQSVVGALGKIFRIVPNQTPLHQRAAKAAQRITIASPTGPQAAYPHAGAENHAHIRSKA